MDLWNSLLLQVVENRSVLVAQKDNYMKGRGIEENGELAQKRSWGHHRSVVIILNGELWGLVAYLCPQLLVFLCLAYPDNSLLPYR